MSTLGFGQAGTPLGPSSVFLHLPFRNYRDWGTDRLRAWVEEFINAATIDFDILNRRFISSQARQNLLEPSYTPVEVASTNLATATAPATGATVTHTMLDILCYAAGVPTPRDTNLTVAKAQGLVQAAWDALRWKGTRARLLRIASLYGNGVAFGVSSTAFNWGVALTDGEPAPGHGIWVPPASTNANQRPWVFGATNRHYEEKIAPSWSANGVGYSQFRAGYSAVGEPVFPTGSRLNIFQNEHFSTWAAGVPSNWTSAGTGGALNQGSGGGFTNINFEFSSNVAEFAMAGAANGTFRSLAQTVTVNNQVTHRVEVDYYYRQTFAPFVDKLTLRIFDVTNQQYYNTSTAAWQTDVYAIPLPVSESTIRTRYAVNVPLQAASNTKLGTQQITATVRTDCDGTTASQINYWLYRVGIYETFDLTRETTAGGDRSLWLPLRDAIGITTFAQAAGRPSIESNDAPWDSYKVIANGDPDFPHHPAVSGRSYRAGATWTNLVLGSNDFGVDWTLASCTRVASAEISPIVGETTPTASRITLTAASGTITQSGLAAIGAPPVYVVGGLWVKRISAGSGTVRVNLSAQAGGTSVTWHVPITASDGWKWCAAPAVTFVAGDAGKTLQLQVTLVGANTDQFAVASSYVYAVNGPGIQYPPICQTAVGLSGTVGAKTMTATISGANLDRLTLRRLTSLQSGLLTLTVVPTFDGPSQPDGTLFDFGRLLTADRFVLRVVSGALQATLFETGGAARTASVTLLGRTKVSTDAVSDATWLRDTAIEVQVRWDRTTGLFLAVEDGYAQQATGVPWTVDDAALAGIGVGNNFTGGAGQFDGLLRDLQVFQVGFPA